MLYNFIIIIIIIMVWLPWRAFIREFGMKQILPHLIKSMPSLEAQNFKMYIFTQNTPQVLQVNNLEDISLSKWKM